MKFLRPLAILFALALLTAACGSDDSTDASDSSDTTATESAPADDGGSDDDSSDGADDSSDDDAGDGSGDDANDTAGGCDTPPLKVDGTLTVATGEPAFLPWVADDDPASGNGFESAVVYAVAEEMGIDNVEWVRTGFNEAIAPGSKDYDFNIQQYSINDKRDEVVDFSDGYYQVEQAIIGPADSPVASATSVAELKELRLGAAIGTTSLDFLEDVIDPSSQAQVYDDNVAAKSGFDAGQIDGMVMDLPTAYYITAVEIPDASIIGVLPRATANPEELGMLFEEGSPLVVCVNEALAGLRESGELEEIEEEWLSQGGSIPTLSN